MNIIDATIAANPYSRPGRVRPETKAIILHWVANPGTSAKANRDYFASLAKQKQAPFRYASAQYIVGLSGEILRVMPEEEVAWHCGSSQVDPASGRIYTDWAREVIGEKYASRWSTPNYATVGIEMCHPDSTGKFNHETEEAAAVLAADLCITHHLNPGTALGRHFDVVGWKDCPRWWVSNPDKWEAFKTRVAELVNERGGK